MADKTYQLPYETRGSSQTSNTAVPKQDNVDQYTQQRADCKARGGTWDEQTKTCIVLPPKTEDPANQGKASLTNPEIFTNESGRPSGITLPDGRTFLGLSQENVNEIAQREQAKTQLPAGTSLVGTAQNQLNTALQAQQLQGQVGQFNQQGVSPTGLNVGESATQGIIGAIPRALSLAATGAGVGFLGGAAAGAGIGSPITAPAGAAIGAIGGFVSGIASSMISNFRKQRTDTVNAQKRVLDEGKQTMKDWATMAEVDPANKAYYLSQYNKVSAQIDQAYRQMKLDTNKDLAKFETALPDLAEFEAFYAVGGERDTLDFEMRNSLLVPASPEYKILELSQRRLNNAN